MTYNLRGLYDEALAETEIAAKLVPGHHLPHFIRAFALMGKGAFVPALDSLRKSFRINLRSNSQEPVFLGGLLLRTGHTKEGVEILERVRAETSDVILVRIELAAHYVAEARLDEARELVREIKAVNPNLAAESAAAWMPGFDENDTSEFAQRLRLAGMP
jgi:tetratricopeptide (TPR) repeat protein